MKKVVLFTVVALLVTATGFAQKGEGFKFSAGAELGIASGEFSQAYSLGLGASAQAEIPVQDKLSVVAYGGILLYKGKSVGVAFNVKGGSIIPVRVGVKYFLIDGLYGAFQTGLAFYNTYKNDNTSYAGAGFSFSPQAGYEFKTKSGKALDASVKYEVYSAKLSALGFRLAYIF